MKIRVLFDKEKINGGFDVGWGLSLFLPEENILFDTGEKFSYLENNAKLMGIDLKSLEKIVISHNHWDHTGGLEELLDLNPKVKVYVTSHSDKSFKDSIKAKGAQLVEVTNVEKIGECVYSTGQFIVSYKDRTLSEQGLVIEKDDGLIILSGCCHPGILNVVEKVKYYFKKNVDLVVGGLHLMDKEKRFIEFVVGEVKKMVRRVAPSHCTGFEAISLFKKVFGNDFVEVKVGKDIVV